MKQEEERKEDEQETDRLMVRGKGRARLTSTRLKKTSKTEREERNEWKRRKGPEKEREK